MEEMIATYSGPRWMRLKQAAEYSNLSPSRLKKLVDEAAIIGFPDPDDKRGSKGDGVWIFDRESIDRYRLNQASQSPAAIVRRAVLATKHKWGL